MIDIFAIVMLPMMDFIINSTIRAVLALILSYNIINFFCSFLKKNSEKHNNPLPPPGSPHKGVQATHGVVSIIHQVHSESPIVANHTLDGNTKQHQVLPGATGYEFLPSTYETSIDDEKLLKLVKKGVSSLEKLHRLLRGDEQPTKSYDNSSSIIIGEGAFRSVSPLSTGSDVTEIYSKISFQYSNGVTSTQYFNPRCSTIKASLLQKPLLPKFTHIEIISGVCLFSQPVLSTSPGHGRSSGDDNTMTIPTLPSKVNITLYELETITRLSSAIADTVGLIGRACIHSSTPICVHVDIPDFQYYWTACELLERKLVTVDYAQSWINAIDDRKHQLGSIMNSVISTMLTDRQLSGVSIKITSGTEVAGSLFKKKITSGTTPTMEEVISALRANGKDAAQWREFFDHLDSKSQPLNVGGLGRLGYVFNAVKPALLQRLPTAHGNIRDVHGRRLIIHVDDITEWRILDQAKAYLKKYSKQVYDSAQEPMVVGLFPLQRVFAAGPGRSDLYHQDPGSRLCMDHDRTIVSPLDIIGATYGVHVKERLRLSCLQAGFE